MSESAKIKNNIQKRTLEGVVVSNKGNKTAIVRVDRTMVHPKYNKRFIRSKTYSVHDEQNVAVEGQKVFFVECRPMSKTKRWRLINPIV